MILFDPEGMEEAEILNRTASRTDGKVCDDGDYVYGPAPKHMKYTIRMNNDYVPTTALLKDRFVFSYI